MIKKVYIDIPGEFLVEYHGDIPSVGDYIKLRDEESNESAREVTGIQRNYVYVAAQGQYVESAVKIYLSESIQ